jgi:hypothetical protein
VTDTTPPTSLPTGLRRAVTAVGVVAAVHVAALVLVLTHRGVITTTAFADHPDWPAAQVDSEATSLVLQSVLPHVLIPVLLLWRASTLRSRRPRARTVLTVLLCVQVAAHATLPITLHELPGYGGWVIAVQALSAVFEVAALALLWGPRSSREWFRPVVPTAAALSPRPRRSRP